MMTFMQYAKSRYFSKSHGFGRPWVKWLWLDAALFAAARCLTLASPFFWNWCRRVDSLFDQYAYEGSFTKDTGLDCWIDAYWDGLTPTEAFESEIGYWDN